MAEEGRINPHTERSQSDSDELSLDELLQSLRGLLGEESETRREGEEGGPESRSGEPDDELVLTDIVREELDQATASEGSSGTATGPSSARETETPEGPGQATAAQEAELLKEKVRTAVEEQIAQTTAHLSDSLTRVLNSYIQAAMQDYIERQLPKTLRELAQSLEEAHRGHP